MASKVYEHADWSAHNHHHTTSVALVTLRVDDLDYSGRQGHYSCAIPGNAQSTMEAPNLRV